MKRTIVGSLVALTALGCGGSNTSLEPEQGVAGAPCYGNGTCNTGLACVADRCVAIDASLGETPLIDANDDTTSPKTDTAIDSFAPDTFVVDTSAPEVSGDTAKASYAPAAVFAAACDELGALPDVAGVVGDDSASKIAALPFPFKLFAVPVTSWSMTSNGFLQLWTSSTGTPSTKADNVAIANAAEPNGIVAPFWDDLEVVFSNARATTLGSAPNRRFVASWVHWSIKGQPSVRVSFQVKLFETTNVIELHYCGMAPDGNPRATGGSATIGIESVDGAQGMQHAFDKAGAVKTGDAIRFVPTP